VTEERRLYIETFCPSPSTLEVRCIAVECIAVMLPMAVSVSLPKYTFVYK